MARKPDSFEIIRDTREKDNHGYYFEKEKFCTASIDQKLDTGDYTIVGLEDKLCIERKASVSEIAANLGSKWETFEKEISRMQEFEHRFLVLEFSIADVLRFPQGANIPRGEIADIKMRPKFLLKLLNELMVYDGINVVFCGNRDTAYQYVISLMKRVYEQHNDKGRR